MCEDIPAEVAEDVLNEVINDVADDVCGDVLTSEVAEAWLRRGFLEPTLWLKRSDGLTTPDHSGSAALPARPSIYEGAEEDHAAKPEAAKEKRRLKAKEEKTRQAMVEKYFDVS